MFFPLWACGAAGSALPWHGRGHRFDPGQVHQSNQQLSESARRPGFAPPLGWRGSLGARCCTDTALRAPPQNWRRSVNWISRGVPAPTGLTGVVVFTLLVMLPKPLTKMGRDSACPQLLLHRIPNTSDSRSQTPDVFGM